jgi:hypothetical protein
MRVTFQPVQILSRVAAVVLIGLPLALLRMAVDNYERDSIPKMSHQELIAFVEELHASSFLSAYGLALATTLVLVFLIEGLALGLRLIVGQVSGPKPAFVQEDAWARTSS